MNEIIINSKKALDDYKSFLDANFEKSKYLRVACKTGKQRTGAQNRALHLYCTMVADALNDAGIEFDVFFKEGYQVPWTMELIKDNVWRPVQKAITGKESTTKPETIDYPAIYDVVNRKLAEFGIHIPWPCMGDNSHIQ